MVEVGQIRHWVNQIYGKPFLIIDICADRFGNRCVNILLNGEISKDWELSWIIKNSVAINEAG